jgi:hypothetical protein
VDLHIPDYVSPEAKDLITRVGFWTSRVDLKLCTYILRVFCNVSVFFF